MFKVGLTGGIASGKSKVSQLFAELGATIIDTDKIAFDLSAKNKPAYIKIIQKFGPDFVDKQNNLDRAKLRKIIFQDCSAKKWLENLLHPLIWQEVKNQLRKKENKYAIIVVPLLVETNLVNKFDRILVMDTTKDLQVARLMHRDDCDKQTALNIIQQQVNSGVRKAHADDIIENNKDIAHLALQVATLHQKYSQLANKKEQND